MAWVPFRHVGLKAVALALGVLLWLTVSGHQITRRMGVDVSYSHVPASVEMVGDQGDASALVRGDDSIVSALPPGALRLLLDLSDAHVGANLIQLRTDQVLAPSNIEVLQIDPGSVTVTLEKSGQREALVHATIEGKPAAGYVVGDVLVDPKTITVVGPESRLRSGVSVVTERISIDDRTTTVTELVGVVVVDSQVRLPEPRRVKVVVPITPDRAAR